MKMRFPLQSLFLFALGFAEIFAQEEDLSIENFHPPLTCNFGLRYQENRGCIDVDECTEQAPCQIDQTCRNLYGSYLCICQSGFILDDKTGECVDKDECEMGFCGSGQQCINTIGSFTCVCSNGTTKIGRFCRDVNECIKRPCDNSNQYCINTRGSYRCICRQGYTDNGEGKCVDTDECTQEMCQGVGEMCQNTVGGYECVCREGFTKDERTHGRYCIDVNECDLNPCSEHSECINTQGSYHCRCHKGFTLYDGTCVDNQECRLGEGNKCQWRCENQPGSFICQCPSGYYRVDFACNDINECDVDPQTCDDGQICVNTHGSYKCITPFECPNSTFYRKLMTTDEFGYRQITTNICRRKNCRRLTRNKAENHQCRALPLSVSHHFIDITSGLNVPTNLLRIKFPARRRRQNYNFEIIEGDRSLFSLRQPAMYRPLAFLVLNRSLTGSSEHEVKVDMRTYNRRGKMRDNRMLTISIIVSQYDF